MFSHSSFDYSSLLQPILDTQCIWVFVELKKGTEITVIIISEVTEELKCAVREKFGNDVVPQVCLVSSAVKCISSGKSMIGRESYISVIQIYTVVQ